MNDQDLLLARLREQIDSLETQLAAAHARVAMLEQGLPVPCFVARQATLTKQELAVLLRFFECFNDKEVARRTGRKLQTVRNQMASIMHKLGARSRGELIVRIISSGATDKIKVRAP
jgi:DNA-binding NarL/FixJ family response regulator